MSATFSNSHNDLISMKLVSNYTCYKEPQSKNDLPYLKSYTSSTMRSKVRHFTPEKTLTFDLVKMMDACNTRRKSRAWGYIQTGKGFNLV